jgi:hypothetical protein
MTRVDERRSAVASARDQEGWRIEPGRSGEAEGGHGDEDGAERGQQEPIGAVERKLT